MTRETRIGLLIGLGFIVLFGVVLAGLLNPEKLPAPNAPSGNATLAYDPARDEVPTPKPEAPVVAIHNDAVPIVTAVEPTRVAVAPAGPTPVVEVGIEGPGARVANAGTPTRSEIVRSRGDFTTPSLPRQTIPTVDAVSPAPIPVVGAVDRGPTSPTALASADQVPGLKYKILAGDTLGKLAAKFYGHSSDYKIILTANSSLRDATNLKIGQEIVIPPAPAKAAALPTTPALAAAPAAPATPAVAMAPAAVPATVVRPADAPSLRRALSAAAHSTDHAAVPASRTVTPEPADAAPAPGLTPDPTHGDMIETPAAPGSTPSPASGASIAARMRSRMDLGSSLSPAPASALAPTALPGADAAPKKTYEIQQGDTLSKIASKMMKDSSKAAVQKIIDLNKGKISSPESLKIGMKLEIPS
jgi:LysM repeat protein